MSSRIRFATAQSVFEAFPDLGYLVPPPTSEIGPLDFARALSSGPRSSEAILFLSHLLPRREAVWWALNCVRTLVGEDASDEAFRAAEIWVRTPEDDHRTGALRLANDSDRRKPTTWLAFSAGWSGGSIAPPDQQMVPPPAGACAMAANAAVLLAVAAGDPRAVADRTRACAEAGVRFACGGKPTVFVQGWAQ